MASELVKEIEEALLYMRGLAEAVVVIGGNPEDIEKHCSTLQRAREALSWIPVSEKPVSNEEYPQYQVYMPNVRGDKFRLAYYFEKCEPNPWSVNGFSRLQATAEITHYRPVPEPPEESSSSAKATEDK